MVPTPLDKCRRKSVLRCAAKVSTETVPQLLSAMIAITVVIINVLLKTTVVALVRWEKHSTVSSQERAITLKLFMGLFINTGSFKYRVTRYRLFLGVTSVDQGY